MDQEAIPDDAEKAYAGLYNRIDLSVRLHAIYRTPDNRGTSLAFAQTLILMMCLMGCSPDLVGQYRSGIPLPNRAPSDLASLEIKGADWSLAGCWDCYLTVQYSDSSSNWQTMIRHGKLSWPLWSAIRETSDGNHLLIPYLQRELVGRSRYELMALDVVNRRETRVDVSDELAEELGWKDQPKETAAKTFKVSPSHGLQRTSGAASEA